MYKRGGVWWTCVRLNGRKVQRSLETADKKLAKSIEAKIRVEIAEGKYFHKPVGEKKTFSDLMEKFLSEYAITVSRNMQTAYKYYLKNLTKFFGNPQLVSISRNHVASYKIHRRKEGASSSTINRELYMLSKAFNLAVREWEWLDENPVSKVAKETEDNERDRWLTHNDEERLLAFCPEWLKDLVVFALHTGLRQDELLSLEWSRVDLNDKSILITLTKNKKPKMVPLNDVALNILKVKSQLRSIKNNLVFISQCGTKINRSNLIRAFGKALQMAGIENFRWHDLRHTFASRLVQQGEDIYKVAKLLGHRNINTTQRYSHHNQESLRSGVEKLLIHANV